MASLKEHNACAKHKKNMIGFTGSSKKNVQFLNGEIEYTHSAISRESTDKECIQNELTSKTPLESIHLFLDDEILQLVLDFSLKYVQDNDRLDFHLSKNDLLNFIGGIYPINENIFADDEFLSSFVTDRVEINSTNADNTFHTITSGEDQEPPTSATESTTNPSSEEAKEPAAEVQVINTNIPSCSITDPTVTLEIIRPFPKAGLRKRKTGGTQEGKSRILTDTPVKIKIEKKSRKKNKQSVTKRVFDNTSAGAKVTKKPTIPKVPSESETSDRDIPNYSSDE
ncbi:hypothetical protein JTB14_015358 [Gonioctena quinquepunctata]|nr:hypothetical protein JTB14_015358 [Gonioctena quinquepunctata]